MLGDHVLAEWIQLCRSLGTRAPRNAKTLLAFGNNSFQFAFPQASNQNIDAVCYTFPHGPYSKHIRYSSLVAAAADLKYDGPAGCRGDQYGGTNIMTPSRN